MANPDLGLDPASAPVQGPISAAADSQRIFVASQWQLMWWRFRKHRVAVASPIHNGMVGIERRISMTRWTRVSASPP
jgi:hypothetical protein